MSGDLHPAFSGGAQGKSSHPGRERACSSLAKLQPSESRLRGTAGDVADFPVTRRPNPTSFTMQITLLGITRAGTSLTSWARTYLISTNAGGWPAASV
jgi:hypothetical protein